MESEWNPSEQDLEIDQFLNLCWCCRIEEAYMDGLCGQCWRDEQFLNGRKV
jgi:hypothetical protein